MKALIFAGIALFSMTALGQTGGFGPPTFPCAQGDTYQDLTYRGVSWKCGPGANNWAPTPAFQPWGSSGSGSSISLENVYSSAGSFTFAHGLNSLFPQVTCYTRTGGTYSPASWTATPIDVNDTSITVPSAGDYICAFSSVTGLTANFNIAVSPATMTYWPTMIGMQTTPAYTVTQSAIGGYTGTAAYTASGLVSGMTALYTPSSITGAGTSSLTLSFPANQAAATTSFTVQGSDGVNTHAANPSITVGNINAGLVEGWPMADGSGNTFASCCTGNTETLATGTLTWQTNAGLPGTTPLFSSTAYTTGANQTATNFSGSTPFSVSAWINLTGSPGVERTIVSTLDTANSFIGWEFCIDGTAGAFHPHVFIVNTYPSNALEVAGASAITGSALHFVVLTYDGSRTPAGVTFYVDGAAQTNGGPLENSLTGTTANTKNPSIGGRTNGTQPFNGVIAYTRIYNRVLSSTDVANYYAAGAR